MLSSVSKQLSGWADRSRQTAPRFLSTEPGHRGTLVFHWGKMTAKLNVTNVSDHRIAFKVKTTAPRDYVVRPASGFLLPAHTTDIQFCLVSNFSLATPHRFLIECLPAPLELVAHKAWDDLRTEHARQLQVYKFHVKLPVPTANSDPAQWNELESLEKSLDVVADAQEAMRKELGQHSGAMGADGLGVEGAWKKNSVSGIQPISQSPHSRSYVWQRKQGWQDDCMSALVAFFAIFACFALGWFISSLRWNSFFAMKHLQMLKSKVPASRVK